MIENRKFLILSFYRVEFPQLKINQGPFKYSSCDVQLFHSQKSQLIVCALRVKVSKQWHKMASKYKEILKLLFRLKILYDRNRNISCEFIQFTSLLVILHFLVK